MPINLFHFHTTTAANYIYVRYKMFSRKPDKCRDGAVSFTYNSVRPTQYTAGYSSLVAFRAGLQPYSGM